MIHTPRAPAQRMTVLLMGVLVLCAGVLAGCGASQSADDREQPTFSYVIPAGAGADIDAGKPLDILPGELVAELGETIQIVNNDDRAHLLGPWFVGPGETLRQRFVTAGVFDGECSVHPSGQFTVTVNDA